MFVLIINLIMEMNLYPYLLLIAIKYMTAKIFLEKKVGSVIACDNSLF
jgi:hypothetical protein